MFCKNIYTADMKYVIKQQVDNHHNDYNISRAPWDERTLAISNCLQLKCINFCIQMSPVCYSNNNSGKKR